MTHIDTGKTANVHPDEVVNWKPHGWRESAPTVMPLPPPPAPEARPKLGLPKKD